MDEPIARSQLQRTAAYLDENRERALENAGIPGGIDTVSYILLGMAPSEYPERSDHRCLGTLREKQPIARWPLAMPNVAPG